MKPLILHIGVHKTATTTMQQLLLENAQALATQQVQYIPLQHMRKQITPLIVQAASEHEALKSLAAALVTRPDTTILISEENICGAPREILRGTLYPHAQARVRALVYAVSPRPVELFLTLRDPSTFLVSLYCEYLRNNRFLSFFDYTSEFDIEGFSFAQIFHWLSSLPAHVKICVLPFETEFGGGLECVTATILRAACGGRETIDVAVLPNSKSRTTFSSEEIRLFQTIADSAGPDAVRDFINMAERRGHRFGSERYQPLAGPTQETITARYRCDLSWLIGQNDVAKRARSRTR